MLKLNFFKRRGEPERESRIEFFKKKLKKGVERRELAQQRKHRLRYYLERSGLGIDTGKL